MFSSRLALSLYLLLIDNVENMNEGTAIDTEKYTLMLRIDSNELTYAYYHPAVDNSLVSERIALHRGDVPAQAVEREVYAREILLQPFKRVYVILPSSHFVLVPNDVATQGDKGVFFTSLYPDSECDIVESSLPHIGAVMLSGADAGLTSFIRRTFDCPTLLHPLTALCEYFYRKSRLGNQRKVYVHLYRGRMDVVCYSREGLLLANSYNYGSANDAAYYVLNVWKQLGFDQAHDEVHIAGDGEVRRELSQLLRNYILTVVPVIFPSNRLVLGSDAMQLPFDLTALSLCEL